MKRFLTMVAIAAATMLSLQSCEKDDRLINPGDLPTTASTFISDNFPGASVRNVVKDYDDATYTYQVSLSDGTFIEFRKNGEWKEIENRTTGVPTSVVPTKIAEYVTTNYPDNFIVDIERDHQIDVELNSGLDLDFTKDGDFLRVDL